MPEFILLSPAAFARLFALTQWYENAPKEEFGERFHEHVDQIITEIFIGENAPCDIGTTHYLATTEITDGKLYAMYDAFYGDAATSKVEIRSKTF